MVFSLPPGYRPATTVIVGGNGPTGVPTAIVVSDTPVVPAVGDLPLPPGAVAVSTDPGSIASLDAASFRVADAATARANAHRGPVRLPEGLFKLR